MQAFRNLLLVPLLALAAFAAERGPVPSPQPLPPSRAAAVEDGVRAFAGTVAADVTREGPSAWRRHFSDSPAFFMAVNGRLQFPDTRAATHGIQEAARMIPRIQLRWGDDLRVDVLTAQFAVVAATFHEALTDPEGHETTQSGFFTGLAESRNGRWQFRNAHWSVPVPEPKAP
jgi:hypothetical protein